MRIKLGLGSSLAFFLLLTLIIVAMSSGADFLSKWKKQIPDALLPAYEINRNTSAEALWATELLEDKTLYLQDPDGEPIDVFVTALPDQAVGAVPFSQMHAQSYEKVTGYNQDTADQYTAVYVAFGQPEPAETSIAVNGSIELRGQSARILPQKSYKIKLMDPNSSPIGLRVLNLNKHFEDPTRIRNKLTYDLIERIPKLYGLRTRFARLYIRDSSTGDSAAPYQYYGLYTLVEQPGKRFLESRGLDPRGPLYKVEDFEFYTYEDIILPSNDPSYSEAAFQERLEIVGSEDHAYLIEMLKAVNDYSVDINRVIDKYFDRDNVLDWLALNVLTDNYDTQSRNLLLYSSSTVNRWQLIPWDYDKGWSGNPYRPKWAMGVSNYWGMVLFNRFLKEDDNRRDLAKHVEAMRRDQINRHEIAKLISAYYPLLKASSETVPDSDYMYKGSELDSLVSRLPEMPDIHYQGFLESLENPLPFYLNEPEPTERGIKFTWAPSYDFQNSPLVYDFLLAADPTITQVLIHENGLTIPSHEVAGLAPGTYYWQIIARDNTGRWQYAFDYTLFNDETYFGVRKFVYTGGAP